MLLFAWPRGMRGRVKGNSAHVLLALALALCLPVSVDAYASRVDCSKSITSGSIHSIQILRSSSQQVRLARGGSPIACGGTLTPSESGLTLSKSSTGSEYCTAPSVCPRTHGHADGGTLTHYASLRSK